eukprot:1149353-Pelagomonas_calceolata.AAC.1
MGWQMEITENLDEKELCWAPKRMSGGQSSRILWARSPISPDAKLAGEGQILLNKLSALALWNALWRTSKRSGVLLASGLLNPCLNRLERARSAVGRKRLGLLCWPSNSCMRRWKVGQIVLLLLAPMMFLCWVFIAEASTGRASPGYSYVELLSLLVSVATKHCQAFPVVTALADITNVHIKVGRFRIYRLQTSGVVAYLATCTFNVGAGSGAGPALQVLSDPPCICKCDVKVIVVDGVDGVACCGLLSQLFYRERVRLLGGPSSGSSVCRPGGLALMLGASPSEVLKAFLGCGFTSGEGESALDRVVFSKRGSDACLVSGAISFPEGLAIGLCRSCC